MSGVYDTDRLYCPVCKEVTKHLTGWESEFPDQLEVQCTKHVGEQWAAGNIRVIKCD